MTRRSGIFFDAGEFAAGNQRWRRGARIAALGGHEVGEVQAAGGDADQRLFRLQGGFGGVLDGECSGPERLVITKAFMQGSLAGQTIAAEASALHGRS